MSEEVSHELIDWARKAGEAQGALMAEQMKSAALAKALLGMVERYCKHYGPYLSGGRIGDRLYALEVLSDYGYVERVEGHAGVYRVAEEGDHD